MAQLLSNLPIGAKIKFGKYSVNGEAAQAITWLIVAKDHSCTPAYPTNSVTLLTEKLIDLRCVDAPEPNNPDAGRAAKGNNRYSLSNIDQWLNKDSGAGQWFAPTHDADQAPTASYVPLNTMYADRPGFLNAFTAAEKNAILSSMIRVVKSTVDGGGYEDISRKVFLPSAAEINRGSESNNSAEGSAWTYFGSGAGVSAYLTQQAFDNTLSTDKPTAVTREGSWWLRTAQYSGSNTMFFLQNGKIVANAVYATAGIRPTVNIPSTLTVSDATDSDGCYTFLWNSAPNPPPTLAPPTTVYGGKANSISWGFASDPDGDTLTYQLECSLNGGNYTTIYNGASTVYAHLVPFGSTSVAYRVKATDPKGASSAYTTSATRTVVNNNAPVISGVDYNLGVKSSGFTGKYTVTDANNNAVTVTEAIDGKQIRALVATLGQEITYSVTENTWLALSNGSHTLTITATDGIDTSVRTITFTKLVDTLTIQNSLPWIAAEMPTRIMLVVTRNVPSTATFKVEVCNNGYDPSPTWEDATAAVTSGLVHVFTNKTKTTLNWAVLVRVTVARNGATGACYVSAIGGNFE